MSLRAIPLIAISFILYNILALLKIDLGHCISTAEKACTPPLFSVPMPSHANWTFTWGDLLIIITLVMLFIELLKSTFANASSLVDHALSLVVMMACLVEFVLVPQAATSVFFVILFATMIDVIAGYTIGTSVARRSLNVGGSDNN